MKLQADLATPRTAIVVRNPTGWPAMTDILSWSIDLRRWFGVQVRVHYFLVLFALSRLIWAALAPGHAIGPTVAWLVLLIVVLALHELGHALMAKIHDSEPEPIQLWPLGNLVIPGPSRSNDSVSIAAAGLLTSFTLAIGTAVVLAICGTSMIFNPFGYFGKESALVDLGAPILAGSRLQVPALQPLWWAGWFGYLNWMIFLVNLIPAFPFDGGRILRVVLARSPIGLTRDNPYAQWTARSCALILALVGLFRMVAGPFDTGLLILFIAVLIELIVQTEARMLDDGGFYEEGVFGYDFSEGYTSLEGSTAKVRPIRESALKRWRRRRSDARRQRRADREAAEELRLDEILDKLHQRGKGSLTDEEQRFLIQASSKIRNRPKAQRP